MFTIRLGFNSRRQHTQGEMRRSSEKNVLGIDAPSIGEIERENITLETKLRSDEGAWLAVISDVSKVEVKIESIYATPMCPPHIRLPNLQ